MSKIKGNKCFDKDLNQFEDLDFFIMSSKNNIVLEINDTFYCFKRKELIDSFKNIKHYKSKYYKFNGFINPENFKDFSNLILTEEAFKSLDFIEYRFYSTIVAKTFKIGNVCDLIKYKLLKFK